MKKLFLKRLSDAIVKHGVTKGDIIRSYIANTYITDSNKAQHTLNKLLHCDSGISIYDIVACAKACNCTSDYLLGLSDRMNRGVVMSEKTVRFLFGVVAVLAIVVLFYVAGLYEQYLISDKQFIVRFVALIMSFVYSAGQAGAFDDTPEADKKQKRP